MPSSSLAHLHFRLGRVARWGTLGLTLGTASLVAAAWANEPPFADDRFGRGIRIAPAPRNGLRSGSRSARA